MTEQYSNNYLDNPISITPSGFFGSDASMIGTIEDFLTNDELNKLGNFIRGNTSWDITETHYNEDGTVIYDSGYWDSRVATQPTLDRSDPSISPLIASIVKRLKPHIDDFFNVDAMPTNPA